jgi:DNA-binding NtrC family response regulator
MNILLVDDDRSLGEMIAKFLRKQGYEVVFCSSSDRALEQVRDGSFDIMITDIRLPGINGIRLVREVKSIAFETQVIIITGFGNSENAIAALRAGASDFLVKPIDLNDLLFAIQKVQKYISLLRENILQQEISRRRNSEAGYEGTDSFIGLSPEARRVRELIGKAAENADTSVLITGESGTGKEVAASLIHRRSRRAGHAFISVDCSGFPESLIESELFGHEKGAFTGAAYERKGVIELAHQGTLFLDEIGDMPRAFQSRFLRVIEEKRIRKVGGQKKMPVDFRLVCATNRNLEQMTTKGEFRRDLYFRINILNIHLPPLRNRKGDIPLLIEHFIRFYSKKLRKRHTGISKEAAALMEAYPFPGNVRELKNMIERAMILSDSECLQIRDFPSLLVSPVPKKEQCAEKTGLEQWEQAKIRQALEKNRWHLRRTAEHLGIGYDALRYRMRKYSIRR